MNNSPLIVALDTDDVSRACFLAETTSPYVWGVKLGLEFFVSNGVEGVKRLKEFGLPVFLDLKLYDIPNTVARAVHNVSKLDIAMLTVHLSGGRSMLEAALEEANDKTNILGVSVLTSMSDKDLDEVIGDQRSVEDQVMYLAALADSVGLPGMVCSAHECSIIKERFPELSLVVPGIRPENAEQNDQSRIVTPREAIDNGADYLVVGRPITQAEDPAEAAKIILNSL